MCDSFTRLELDLIYTVYRDYDVVCRRAVVRNASKTVSFLLVVPTSYQDNTK